jgi:hypothetical protein
MAVNLAVGSKAPSYNLLPRQEDTFRAPILRGTSSQLPDGYATMITLAALLWHASKVKRLIPIEIQISFR